MIGAEDGTDGGAVGKREVFGRPSEPRSRTSSGLGPTTAPPLENEGVVVSLPVIVTSTPLDSIGVTTPIDPSASRVTLVIPVAVVMDLKRPVGASISEGASPLD